MKDKVAKSKDWYEGHAKRPMILFRTFGALVIVLSVCVPFLGTLDESAWKSIALSLVALAIAGLTGLNAFFQWQNQWQGFRQTQFALEHLLSKWKLEIVKVKYHPDKEEALQTAVEATARLLDQAREATVTETGEFFKGVQVLHTK